MPFPSPGDLPHPGIKPESPALAGRFFRKTKPPGKPLYQEVGTHSLGSDGSGANPKPNPWAIELISQQLDLPAKQMWFRSLCREDPLEKEMATHSSILTWRIPWTEEPGALQSMGSQRVGHD